MCVCARVFWWWPNEQNTKKIWLKFKRNSARTGKHENENSVRMWIFFFSWQLSFTGGFLPIGAMINATERGGAATATVTIYYCVGIAWISETRTYTWKGKSFFSADKIKGDFFFIFSCEIWREPKCVINGIAYAHSEQLWLTKLKAKHLRHYTANLLQIHQMVFRTSFDNSIFDVWQCTLWGALLHKT